MAFTISAVVLLLIAGTAVFYLLQLLSPKRLPKGAKLPPGPKGLPLLGNVSDFADGKLINTFNRYAKEYGPIVQFSLMGEKQVVLSSEKVTIDLFVNRAALYSDRKIPHAMEYITKNLNPALRNYGDPWRRQRKFIHHGVSVTTNARYQQHMSDEATRALYDLTLNPPKYAQQFTRYSYAVLTRCLLGFRTLSVDDKYVQDSERNIDESLKCFRPDEYPSNIFWPLRYLPSWTMKSLGNMQRLRKQNEDNSWAVRARVEREIKDGTSLDSLYRKFLQNRKDYDITDEESVYAFMSMIGAGTRSPSNALLTFCYLMMEYPEWLSKLQKQLDEVVGKDRLPASDDIPQLPMVRAIVKEGIRYRTIVAELGIPHALMEDDVYEGYFFEKGTVFHANYGAILMDKKLYPDQQAFNPARWLEPSYPTYREPLTRYPNTQGFGAFGYGRRVCPGYDFAERTLNIMVAKLAWACNITKPIDPATKKPVELVMEYEPTPNPAPLPFPCDIAFRDEGRRKVLQMAVEKLD